MDSKHQEYDTLSAQAIARLPEPKRNTPQLSDQGETISRATLNGAIAATA